MKHLRTRNGSALLSAVAATVATATVLLGVGFVRAQNDGDTYTGCLSRSGVLTRVAVGDEPVARCNQSQEQISWNQTGPPGPGSTEEVDALRADLDALMEVITIDPTTGAVTIAAEADLVLESEADLVLEAGDADADEVKIMDDAMLEGDTTLMEDATVMGETMLEGDATLMEDTEIIGDATFEGSVALPDTTTVVDAAGSITPVSSSVNVTGFTGEPLRRIAPAAVDGTLLEIHFGVSTADVGSFVGQVVPCSPGCGGPVGNNIDLRQRQFEPFEFDVGDTLRLMSDGATWIEVSRSSGHAEVFTTTPTGFFVAADSTETQEFAACTDPSLGGRAGAILLLGDVEVTNIAVLDPALVTDQIDIELITVGPDAGTEIARVTVTNDNPVTGASVDIVFRCLST